jgi:hypothetical protein
MQWAPSTDRHPNARAFAFIAALFAFTLLVDRAKRHGLSLENLVVVVPALLVVAWPRFRLALVVLAGTQIVTFFVTGSIQIIWYVCSAFFASVLIVFATATAGRLLTPARLRARPRLLAHPRGTLRLPTMSSLYDGIAGPAHAIAVIGMFAAGFAKLNHDFLNPDVSCGAIYTSWLLTSPFLFFVPTHPVVEEMGLYAALAIELSAPLLLLHRRTRAVGLALYWLLCIGLALNPRSHYFDFAGLYFALSLFFVPARLVHRSLTTLRACARRVRARIKLLAGHRRTLAHMGHLALFAFASTLALGPSLGLRRAIVLDIMRHALLITWGVLLSLLVFHAVRRRESRASAVGPRYASARLAFCAPLCMFVNEVSPYVGLIHRPTMTMAANLEMHPGSSNHLLVKEPLTFSFSRQVRIVSSTHTHVKRGQHMPHLLFVDLMARDQTGGAAFIIDEGPEETARGDDARFTGGAPLARLLRLHPHGPPRRGAKGCGKARPKSARLKTGT